jgi:hypothetical protein
MLLQHGLLDAALIGVMVIGVLGTLYHRLKMELGIGDRAIQLVAICLVIPTVLILGLEGKIKEDSMGTIVGAMIGYALGSLGNPDPRKPKESKESKEPKTPKADSN